MASEEDAEKNFNGVFATLLKDHKQTFEALQVLRDSISKAFENKKETHNSLQTQIFHQRASTLQMISETKQLKSLLEEQRILLKNCSTEVDIKLRRKELLHQQFSDLQELEGYQRSLIQEKEAILAGENSRIAKELEMFANHLGIDISRTADACIEVSFSLIKAAKTGITSTPDAKVVFHYDPTCARYEVRSIEPPLENNVLLDIVANLNETKDLGRFISTVRLHFKKHFENRPQYR